MKGMVVGWRKCNGGKMNSTDEFCPASPDSLIQFHSTPATCVVAVIILILLLISTSCKNGKKQKR